MAARGASRCAGFRLRKPDAALPVPSRQAARVYLFAASASASVLPATTAVVVVVLAGGGAVGSGAFGSGAFGSGAFGGRAFGGRAFGRRLLTGRRSDGGCCGHSATVAVVVVAATRETEDEASEPNRDEHQWFLHDGSIPDAMSRKR